MIKLPKKIEKIFKEKKINFEIIEHRKTYTAGDTAATTAKSKIIATEIVKTLVVKIDREYALALLSSDRNFDVAKFKKIVNDVRKKLKKRLAKGDKRMTSKIKACKKIELAKESWMKKNLPGKIGAVPPFSRLTGAIIFIDRVLLRQKNLYLGSGEYEILIKITPKNYERLEKEIIKCNFSKIRKKEKNKVKRKYKISKRKK